MDRLLRIWGILCVLVLILYSLLPVDGTVILLGTGIDAANLPQIRLSPPSPAPGVKVIVKVIDAEYQTFTQLSVDGVSAKPLGAPERTAGVYTWTWEFTAPDRQGFPLEYYVNCHTGCELRRQVEIGVSPPANVSQLIATKLGLVMANPQRDWYSRSGWAVELTYATESERDYWGIDDLAARIHQHLQQGLRVLIRVDYAPDQSFPGENDLAALTEYLVYLRRVARDQRFADVYGFVIGSDMNVSTRNTGQSAVSPEWYARVFVGYDQPAGAIDNAVQTIYQENQTTRVIAGPVRPWVTDADGAIPYHVDAPWLNYMHTLVSRIDETIAEKSVAGINVSFGGFDVQAPANLTAVLLPDLPEREPELDLYHSVWPEAQAGFRVYSDWLDIINAFPSTEGMPVYIISTNTYQREQNTTPDQNYVEGWLTTAYAIINQEPQIQALCWFLDIFPNTNQWDAFSLSKAPGKLHLAADEFNALLRRGD